MYRLIVCIFTILSINIFGQDQIAKNILDKLNQTSNSYNNISITFELTIENKSQNIYITQIGSLILSGKKFRITIENQTIINNGETQWIFLPEINEVQILNNDPNNMMNPSKIFNLYKEDYKYSYVGTESKKNKQLEIINLFPKESQELMKVNLAIDGEKNEIHQIIIYDKNGGT